MQEAKKGFKKAVIGKIKSSFEIQKDGDEIQIIAHRDLVKDEEKEGEKRDAERTRNRL